MNSATFGITAKGQSDIYHAKTLDASISTSTVIQKVNDFRQVLISVWMNQYRMKNSFQGKEK